jgi:hypothetical protein
MREFGEVEAIQLYLEQFAEIPPKLSFYTVSDAWLVAIVREGQKLVNFVESAIIKAIENYYDQIHIEQNSDGRAINIAHPVRLSGGIQDAIEILETISPKLTQFEQRFDFLNHKARFDSDDLYQDLATAALNFEDTIISRTRLHIHTYLWFLWTHESLNQAIQFYGLLMSQDDFEELSKAAFPYISHPPLIVATIAASTMLEEIGATWVNAKVEKSNYDMDETSVADVMEDIETYHPKSKDFDFTEIEEYVVDARNDISHYVTRRGETVGVEEFEEYVEAVQKVMNLVDVLLSELVLPPIEEFKKELSRLTVSPE